MRLRTIVIIGLVVGGVWYYKNTQSPATSQVAATTTTNESQGSRLVNTVQQTWHNLTYDFQDWIAGHQTTNTQNAAGSQSTSTSE